MTDSPETPLTYRLRGDEPDRWFCERVNEALVTGYLLYGEPILTSDDGTLIDAQAGVLSTIAEAS